MTDSLEALRVSDKVNRSLFRIGRAMNRLQQLAVDFAPEPTLKPQGFAFGDAMAGYAPQAAPARLNVEKLATLTYLLDEIDGAVTEMRSLIVPDTMGKEAP